MCFNTSFFQHGSYIQESELKWKDELEKQKEGYEKLLKQKDDGAPEEDGKQDEKDKPEDTTDKPENEGAALHLGVGQRLWLSYDNKQNRHKQNTDSKTSQIIFAGESEDRNVRFCCFWSKRKSERQKDAEKNAGIFRYSVGGRIGRCFDRGTKR